MNMAKKRRNMPLRTFSIGLFQSVCIASRRRHAARHSVHVTQGLADRARRAALGEPSPANMRPGALPRAAPTSGRSPPEHASSEPRKNFQV
jgi:hypothetical protein